MGAETTVYGYIILDPEQRELNASVMSDFAFDPAYPFTNIFSDIRPGYGGDMISFSGSFKSLDEEWLEWESRFESLLFCLYGRSAQVHLDHETEGAIKCNGYICPEGWHTNKSLNERSWQKCINECKHTARESIVLHLK